MAPAAFSRSRVLSVPCPAASPPRSQVEDALQVSDDGLCSSAACGAFWKPPPGVSPFLPLPVPCLSCSPGSFLNFRFQTLHPTAQCHPARVPRAVLLLSVPFCRTGSFPRGGQGTVPPPPPRSSCRQSRGSRLPLRCGVPALGGEPSGCRVGTSRSVPPLPAAALKTPVPVSPWGLCARQSLVRPPQLYPRLLPGGSGTYSLTHPLSPGPLHLRRRPRASAGRGRPALLL